MNDILISELILNDDTLKKSEYIYTTNFWVKYLCDETKGEPIVLNISNNNWSVIFVGIIFKKYKLRICGSPFEGWSTPYMGFIGLDRLNTDEKVAVLQKTIKYLKKIKHCHYVQICDFNIDYDLANLAKIKYEKHDTYMLDISKTEEELFSSFKVDVRTNCRNFLKRGAKLHIEQPSDKFANDYYTQLVEVFDKQGLKSYYSLEKIQRLINLFKNNKDFVFCENVYDQKDEKSIATGIFFGYKSRCYFFGAASLKDYQILRPNEYVIWNAIKYWKSKGCTTFDMLGIRKYKEKFHPTFVSIPVLYSSRIPFLHSLKKIAKRLILVGRRK